MRKKVQEAGKRMPSAGQAGLTEEAERARRQSVRAEIAVPVSIVSFAIFGLGVFAQYFDVSDWREPVTFAMCVLMALSLSVLLTSLILLARVELDYRWCGTAATA